MARRARAVNMVLGTWLLTSAFLWPHAAGQFRLSWSVGALCIVVAALARTVPPLRYGNTMLGLWLTITTLLGPTLTSLTTWNNSLVGAAILVVSLFPGRPEGIGGARPPAPPAEEAVRPTSTAQEVQVR
jgi:hypothetical protein